MLSFQEFVDQSDHSFDFKNSKQRQKELNIAADEARKLMIRDKKIQSYAIDTKIDPVNRENMIYIGDALGMDTESLTEAIEMNEHLLATSKYQNELKKHFRRKLKKKGRIDGSDFRKIAKLFGRFIPLTEDKNGNPQDSMSTQLLQAAAKEEALFETIAAKALNEYRKETGLLQRLWDGAKWVGSKIMNLFSAIFSGMGAVLEWMKTHKRATAVILMICMAVLCFFFPGCPTAVGHMFVTLKDWVVRGAKWLVNFIKAMFGQNTEFLLTKSEQTFEAQYAAKSIARVAKVADRADKACLAGAAALTGGASIGGPVASIITGAVGVGACTVASYTGVTAMGAKVYQNKLLDPMYIADRNAALGEEQQIFQLIGAFKLFLSVALFFTNRYFKGNKTVQKGVKTMGEIAGGMRKFNYELGKQQQKAYKTVENTILGKDKLKF